MLKKVVNALFGTRHERELKRLWPLVDQINEEWERLQGVSDEELRGQTARFRERIHEATQDLSAELEELRQSDQALLARLSPESVAAEVRRRQVREERRRAAPPPEAGPARPRPRAAPVRTRPPRR